MIYPSGRGRPPVYSARTLEGGRTRILLFKYLMAVTDLNQQAIPDPVEQDVVLLFFCLHRIHSLLFPVILITRMDSRMAAFAQAHEVAFIMGTTL